MFAKFASDRKAGGCGLTPVPDLKAIADCHLPTSQKEQLSSDATCRPHKIVTKRPMRTRLIFYPTKVLIIGLRAGIATLLGDFSHNHRQFFADCACKAHNTSSRNRSLAHYQQARSAKFNLIRANALSKLHRWKMFVQGAQSTSRLLDSVAPACA